MYMDIVQYSVVTANTGTDPTPCEGISIDCSDFRRMTIREHNCLYCDASRYDLFIASRNGIERSALETVLDPLMYCERVLNASQMPPNA